jgi:hypothetical protein
MPFQVHKGDAIHTINEADAGKFLSFFFHGLESRPFKFKSTEGELGQKNVISRPRVHSLITPTGKKVDLAIHLNFFCTPNGITYDVIDIGKHPTVKVIKEINFKIEKLHLTARTKADQDGIAKGIISKEIADRSPHRASNAWGRPNNIKNLAEHIDVTEASLISNLEAWGYADTDFSKIYNMLETALIDQSFAKFSNRNLKVTVAGDKSATFD